MAFNNHPVAAAANNRFLALAIAVAVLAALTARIRAPPSTPFQGSSHIAEMNTATLFRRGSSGFSGPALGTGASSVSIPSRL
jgi:hypothetical protein